VEYDKKRDFSHYKSFSFGESQIITPPDQKQVADAALDKWIKNGVTRELELKGLKRVDSAAQLIVTYAAGSLERSDAESLGPLGLTPGANPSRTWMRDYRQTSLIIDLNDRSNNLIWRVNSTSNLSTADGERAIDAIVGKGFRKFGKPVKKKKD
jgi:hypothetical protein